MRASYKPAAKRGRRTGASKRGVQERRRRHLSLSSEFSFVRSMQIDGCAKVDAKVTALPQETWISSLQEPVSKKQSGGLRCVRSPRCRSTVFVRGRKLWAFYKPDANLDGMEVPIRRNFLCAGQTCHEAICFVGVVKRHSNACFGQPSASQNMP